MSIKLATLFVFVVFFTEISFVCCKNDGIDWDLYAEYALANEDSVVEALANYVSERIQARNPCYIPSSVISAAEQSGPNVIRYHIRMAIRYDIASGSATTIREGYVDAVIDYPTENNVQGTYQLVSMDMSGWVRHASSNCDSDANCGKNPRRQYDH